MNKLKSVVKENEKLLAERDRQVNNQGSFKINCEIELTTRQFTGD